MRQSCWAAITPKEACGAILSATATRHLNTAGAREVAPPGSLAWAHNASPHSFATATA